MQDPRGVADDPRNDVAIIDAGEAPRLHLIWHVVPPELRTSVRPILERYLWLVPGWVHNLHIRWYPQHADGQNVVGECESDAAYLYGQITLYGSWFDTAQYRREQAIIHEIVHLLLTPMATEHSLIIRKTLRDGDAKQFADYADVQWTKRLENAVIEMTAAIQRLPVDTLPGTSFVEEERNTNE